VLLVALGCGAAPAPQAAPSVEAAPAPSGLDLSLDVRGRRIEVSADGVLRAEGCGAARFDWAEIALLGAEGALLAAGPEVAGGRSIAAPDGSALLTVDATEVRAGERALFRIEEDGTLADVGGGRAPISSSAPIPAAHRAAVLGLVALVAVCWESHPRALEEP
jgi:hypothetical protein